MDQIRCLVCNTSSIEGIINSNHTLENVNRSLCFRLANYLKLNQHEDKQFVIRQKIIKYYFKGEFDVAPFVQMNISLIPEVMCIIGEYSYDQLSAIYRLLKAIPNMCGQSGRNDEEEVANCYELQMHSSMKRQKI